MFKRILLATDGTQEGLIALREGAMLAKSYAATVFLLVVDRDAHAVRLANSISPLPVVGEAEQVLARGLKRLADFGIPGSGSVVSGEPTAEIGASARRWKADLVVVGHRRQNAFERWWSGASGAYLVDAVPCSVLIARTVISDHEFERYMAEGA